VIFDDSAQDLADVLAVGADLALTADGGAQHWWDLDGGHSFLCFCFCRFWSGIA
jgi:hypothetical protein